MFLFLFLFVVFSCIAKTLMSNCSKCCNLSVYIDERMKDIATN